MRIQYKKNRGFTLMEIMIVVAIIGLLTALVAPRALRARQRACIETIRSNLRIIGDSKSVWAAERRASTGAQPHPTELVAYFKGD